MDQTPLVEKFDRVASLRKVSASRLGSILFGNGRLRDSLVAGTMSIKRSQELDEKLDAYEAALIAKLQRGEKVGGSGRPKKAA